MIIRENIEGCFYYQLGFASLKHADDLHQPLFTPSLKNLFEESALQNVIVG